jgi:hypothetical protein
MVRGRWPRAISRRDSDPAICRQLDPALLEATFGRGLLPVLLAEDVIGATEPE